MHLAIYLPLVVPLFAAAGGSALEAARDLHGLLEAARAAMY